jgi:hypothetical protein
VENALLTAERVIAFSLEVEDVAGDPDFPPFTGPTHVKQ